MTITVPVTCTREDVKRALDSAETAYNDDQIDRAIIAATESVEGQMHRKFFPLTATRYWDWPNDQRAYPWRLWFDDSELISATQVVSGGITLTAGQYYLEPNRSGPPYNQLVLRLDTQAAFSVGATFQRSIGITGLWGGCPADEDPAGALAAAITDTTTTSITVTDSSLVGVGSILRADTERMIVSAKNLVTTGQTGGTLIDSAAADQVTPSGSASAFAVGEVLTMGTERMLVLANNGTALTVKRGYDGSTLAAHTGATIYAPRALTVVRGALGTTATAHSNSSALVTHRVPGLIRTLTIAETLVTELGETAAYARFLNRGGNSAGKPVEVAVDDLREQAYTRWGRKIRHRAV